MKAIEICGLSKRYGNTAAVDELTLQVERGELISLLGVNGAGKTTAIRMLAGILPPDSGDAFLMGRSICEEPEAARRFISISPQETALAPKLSARENLEFIAEIYGMTRREAKLRADRMIEEFGMAEVEHRRAGTLSGGWQRRLSIAMALAAEPEILFLDEPTLGLDVLARRELWSMLKGLRGRVTILMTTHYLEEAEALSDRIAILQRGRLRAVGTPGELIEISGKTSFEDAFVALAGGENL